MTNEGLTVFSSKAYPAGQDDPLWYKDAVIYELHVRSFFDSDGDGSGDFKGLTEKLDYLQDIGVTTLWLLPFYPSPMKDDGYDISDYTNVDPVYGDLRDFKRFITEAHRRGLRVIIELILNHTSDRHPWFQRACQAKPDSKWRDFYVWSDTPEKYQAAPVLFSDFESSNWAWDSTAKAYYWHRFYTHQPDLNYDNEDVQREMRKVVDFWLDLDVDGLRLVAVPYLFEREGTDCESLPEVHTFVQDLRRHIDKNYQNRVLLAGANQWPEDAAAYFGDGDESHMAFFFSLMPRLFMAVRMEDRFPVVDILRQTPSIPESCQWALFLRNHDPLTLEVVTDTERDYMYRFYTNDPRARLNLGIRRRLAPLLGNDRRKIELMNGLLFSLPGTPIVYYGDEIGMGDNVYLPDRSGVRTPMQWSADQNAGFSRANPQRLHLPVVVDPEFHYEAINVETQHNNPQSLLWWMKRLIALRKQHQALSRGSLEFLYPDNHHVLVYLRRYQEESVLVVANLSRFVQHVELDLSAFNKQLPIELFGRTALPPVGEKPYLLTLSPYSFYWLALEPEHVEAKQAAETSVVTQLPELRVDGVWSTIFEETAKAALEKALPDYVRPRRWFGAKARTIQSAEITEAIPITEQAYLTQIQVNYADGEPDVYMLPLSFSVGEQAKQLRRDRPQAVVAELHTSDEVGVLFDAVWENSFCEALLEAVTHQQHFAGINGELQATATTVFPELRGPGDEVPPPSLLGAEQSNTSIRYGDRLILKLFRRLESGMNPDLEIGHFLTEKAAFAHIPPVAGALEYHRSQPLSRSAATSGMRRTVQRVEPVTLAILQGFVANQGDAWRYTLDALARYFERIMTQVYELKPKDLPKKTVLDLTRGDIPEFAFEVIGLYLESAELLGRRTAELHLALASEPDDQSFKPEPFTPTYQHPLHQDMRNLTGRIFQLLRQRVKSLPQAVRTDAQQLLDLEEEVLKRFRSLVDQKITALRTRVHGDYHLGQVLYTGKDFMIIDFEGEPARSLHERRLKRSPLQDVAGMLRSFHYAAYAAFFEQAATGVAQPKDLAELERWTHFWHLWVSVAFLKTYLEVSNRATFLPESLEELRILLNAYLLEKAVYELGYELNNRPNWVKIPLQGILQIVHAAG